MPTSTVLMKKAADERMYSDAVVMESEGLQIAQAFVTQSYLDTYDTCSIIAPSLDVMNPRNLKIRIVKLQRIVFDPNEHVMDKLISVYSALYNVGATLGIMLKGDKSTTSFYFIVRHDADVESSREVLIDSLEANFPGISYETLDNEKVRKILELGALKGFDSGGTPKDMLKRSVASVSLVPSPRDEDKKKFVQGIEKFIDAMNCREYTALFLATPIDKNILAERKLGYQSLLTRVNSMTQGLIGMIFEDEIGVEDKKLFDEDVIIDLSEIGSEDTNAIIMGVLIMRLNEYRQNQRKIRAQRGEETHDEPLRHITVLEEAHNLLRRTSTEQNDEGTNPAGASVKAIGNSIKEMRTYGEGFLIIDQTPSALDDSAIENTATKIIFNTPGKDATEALLLVMRIGQNLTSNMLIISVKILKQRKRINWLLLMKQCRKSMMK